MRVRTWSACVALAWGIVLLLTVMAVGSSGPFRSAQANTRIASSTSNTSTTTARVTLTSSVTTTPASAPAGRPDPAAVSAAIALSAVRPGARTGTGAPTDTGIPTATGARADTATRAAAGPGRYVVQPGDTLSGIAAATGVPGGWPALYAANRLAIGPDPGLIRPGTALTLPGRAAPARYTVGAGDTLSGIAAAVGVPGGWPALYAANRRVIGPDPDAIRAGTVLAIPHPAPPASHPASSASHAPSPASTRTSAPSSAQPSASATAPATARAPAPVPSGGLQRPTHQTAQAEAPAAGGLPRWLEIVLVAAGLLIATAFLTEPILAIARRRRAGRPAAGDAHIVLADYERLVVTHSRHDGTVYVLRPPDADPHAILLAARLVLAQDRYEALAGHLGVPAHWPRE
jgi:nucleoid-associated protein YgaU